MKNIFLLIPILLSLFSCAENDGSFKNTSNLPDLTPVTNAQYEVVFTSNWNSTSFPIDYPATPEYLGALLITHNNKAGIFFPGEVASAGVNNMAINNGDNTQLLTELNAYQTQNNALLYELGVQNVSSPNAPFQLTMSSKQPVVSLCMKMKPSPNWFLGLANYSLLNVDGTWKTNATVNLVVYDNDDSTTTTTTYNSIYAPNSLGIIKEINPTVLIPSTVGTPIGTLTFKKL